VGERSALIEHSNVALRLAAALGGFWHHHSHWSEGRRWLDAVLTLPAPAGTLAGEMAVRDNRVRVVALNRAADIAMAQYDHARARALAEESAALARAADDLLGLRDALVVLGMVALHRHLAVDEARDLFTQCVALARSLADSQRTAGSLFWLGQAAYRDGDYVRAAAVWEESAALYHACGDLGGRAQALCFLGEALCEMGDVARGMRHLQDAVVPVHGPRPQHVHGLTRGSLAVALARHQGAYGEAEALTQQALAIYRTIGAPAGVPRSHTMLAWLALCQGDDERAETLLDESLRVARAAEAPYEVARALLVQGDLLMYRGLYDRADAVYQERLRMCQAKHILVPTLLSLGILAQRQGRHAQAWERLQRALTLVQGTWLALQSPILAALGRVAAEEGDPVEAERLLRESLGLERAMGPSRETAEALEGLAAVAIAQGRPERAVPLGAAAAGLRASIGAPLSPYERAVFERTLHAVHTSLGAGTFETAWTSAQATPWEQIVDEALAGR
jgi:tetratricopeptide (TPR) repeat protein